MNLFISRAGGWVPPAFLCSPNKCSPLRILGVIICESPPSCSSFIAGLRIISGFSRAQAKRVVRAVTHTVMPLGNMDLQWEVIHQWVHEPRIIPQVQLLLWKPQGAVDLLLPMLMAQMNCLSAHHMQHAALHLHVVVLSLFSCRTCP